MKQTVSKIFCSLSFLCVAWMTYETSFYHWTETEILFGRLMMAGLVFGAIGDVFLLGTSKSAFLGGLATFLVGHIFYGLAFFVLVAQGIKRLQLAWIVGSALVTLIQTFLIWNELSPAFRDPSKRSLKFPSMMYVGVISGVLLMSFLSFRASESRVEISVRLVRVLAVYLFYLSDICVARASILSTDKTNLNGFIGLPLYYIAQLLLASFL